MANPEAGMDSLLEGPAAPRQMRGKSFSFTGLEPERTNR
jgi:hypothetical protein